MEDLALEQVGHGREVDVGVWADVEPPAGLKARGPEVIEENERADRPPLRPGQKPAHGEAVAEAEVARLEQRLDVGLGGLGDDVGIHGRSPAHDGNMPSGPGASTTSRPRRP